MIDYSEQGQKMKEILEHSLELARVGNELRDKQGAIAVIKALYVMEVAAVTRPDGKPQYTNESIRDAAVVLRCAEDKEYKSTLALINTLRERQALLEGRLYVFKQRQEFVRLQIVHDLVVLEKVA